MAPPLKPSMALCIRISATALWLDGPRQEARVSSPSAHITILVLTDSAEPERTQRRRTGGVVRVGRVAAPGAALIAQRRGQYPLRKVTSARIAGAAVVFRADCLGEDDRA